MKPAQLVFTFLLPMLICVQLISCDGAGSRLTKAQVEQKITQDLPTGSDYSNVQLYLENHKIEYSWIEEEKTFYAIFRNTNSDFLVKENIKIIIHMDRERKLQLIQVQSVFIGP